MEMLSAHSAPACGGKVVPSGTKGGSAEMAQEEYDSIASPSQSLFPLATPIQRAELNTARQSSHKSPARDDGAGGPPIVISTEAKRSGEISPSDGTGGITVGDLSTQSIIKAFSICPIPTCISARDDDFGERPSRHFDRSGVEWRNLTPQWARKRVRLSPLDTPSV